MHMHRHATISCPACFCVLTLKVQRQAKHGGMGQAESHGNMCVRVLLRSVPGLSITAVGARRQLVLGVPGIEEDVGMLGIHLPDGTFLELVPWAGQVTHT